MLEKNKNSVHIDADDDVSEPLPLVRIAGINSEDARSEKMNLCWTNR